MNLNEIRKEIETKLLRILIEKNIQKKDEGEIFVFGLTEVAESIIEIYEILIPSIINSENKTQEEIEQLISDLKGEFSHILYHIEDSKLYLFKP